MLPWPLEAMQWTEHNDRAGDALQIGGGCPSAIPTVFRRGRHVHLTGPLGVNLIVKELTCPPLLTRQLRKGGEHKWPAASTTSAAASGVAAAPARRTATAGRGLASASVLSPGGRCP